MHRTVLVFFFLTIFLCMSLAPSIFPEGMAALAQPGPVTDQETEDRKAAEQLVARFSVKGLQILNDNTLSTTEKKQKFGILFQDGADVKAIADFCLGSYVSLPTPQQRARYYDLFLKSVEGEILIQLSAYKNAHIQIESSQYVTSDSNDPNTVYIAVITSIDLGDPDRAPIDVEWRVRRTLVKGKPTYRIVDLLTKGISIALGKRDVYTAVLQSNNGDFDAFLDQMAQKVK